MYLQQATINETRYRGGFLVSAITIGRARVYDITFRNMWKNKQFIA
jgi:hypothetical protein